MCPDDIMRVFEWSIGKEVPIKEGIKRVKYGDLDTGCLPFGTVRMKQSKNVTVYFIQLPEKIIDCQCYEKHYKIAMPWRVYALKFTGNLLVDYYMRFAKGYIKSGNDPIYTVPLPNVNENGSMCICKGMVEDSGRGTLPHTQSVPRIISWIDKSEYNDHLNGRVNLLPGEVRQGVEIGDEKHLFEVWGAWTKEAGSRWRNINTFGWHQCETFEDYYKRIPL